MSPSRLFPTLQKRRCLGIDPGTGHVKFVLVEGNASRHRILEARSIDLYEEGLLNAEEINAQLQDFLSRYQDTPMALVVPEHITVSRVVDLPRTPRREVATRIASETFNLAGLGDSSIIYDYSRILERPGSYWVALAQESEIQSQLRRIGPLEDNLQHVTCPSNALTGAFLTAVRGNRDAVLVDLGATNTVVVVIENGSAIHTVSYPIGGESFTDAFSHDTSAPIEEAEQRKRNEAPFHRLDEFPELTTAIDTWLYELERHVTDWFAPASHDQIVFPSLTVFLSGGEAEQPGLIPYLRNKSALDFQAWPAIEAPEPFSMSRFAIAYGACLPAVRTVPQSVSLLPRHLRRLRRKERRLTRLAAATALLACALVALLVNEAFKKDTLIDRKAALLDEATGALAHAAKVDRITHRQRLEQARLTPILTRSQKTDAFLQAIPPLQSARMRHNLWLLLLADETSYFQGTTLPSGPEHTSSISEQVSTTNLPSSQGALIIEVAIPDDAKKSLEKRSVIVSELQREAVFQNADALPAGRRMTNWVVPEFILSNQTYTLKLELARQSLPFTSMLPSPASPPQE